jgi:geranylgeranyl diphosphate synthase type II
VSVDTGRDLATYLRECRARVDRALDDFLPSVETEPSVIHDAMRYTVMAGGKRLRPILAMAAAEACGTPVEPLLRHFVALELIHTYSLVHDDLPALDNDDLRRGRKTAHVVYGEAMAILTGDALLTEAFAWLAAPIGPDTRRQILAIGTVAQAISSRGMIGGQVVDMQSERMLDQDADRGELGRRLDYIHRNKTGRLLTASVVLGGILGHGTDQQIDDLTIYGEAIGLAFQIVDDLLDLEGSAEKLGKTAGKDLRQGKLTYPSLFGVGSARAKVAELQATATEASRRISTETNRLGELAEFICTRES